MYICIYKHTAFADVLLVQGVGFALGTSSSGRIQAPLSLAQPPYQIRLFLRRLRWIDDELGGLHWIILPLLPFAG